MPHAHYLSLAATEEQRQESYRELFKSRINGNIIAAAIRSSINKGQALGNEHFANGIEQLTKQRVLARKTGRPKREIKHDMAINNTRALIISV